MQYDSQRHHRHSIRLQEYDYSQAGAYFVTLVAQDRALLFGEIAQDQMIHSTAGEIVQKTWKTLPQRFSNIELDEFVIMPNHVHGIIVITEGGTIDVGAIHESPLQQLPIQ